MSNVNRWYASREAVKAAVGLKGASVDRLVDSYIESASERIENVLDRRFIPETATKYYRWPQARGRALILDLDADLLAVTTLQSQAQDAAPVTIVAADYFLEPVNTPPYRRIEIDLSSTASFQSGDTPQRSIAVTGRWSFSEATKAAGALAEVLDISETGVDVTDASKIDVGDTLLIESEQMFVSERATLDTTADLSDTLTAVNSDVTVTVTDGTKVLAGEVILIESEKMLVTAVTGNDLTVERGYDGSVLAAHSGALNIYAFRTLTAVRGVNGTTAATHGTATAITKYAPPADVAEYCRARAILSHKQASGGYTGELGGGEGVRSVEERAAGYMEKCLIERYGLVTI